MISSKPNYLPKTFLFKAIGGLGCNIWIYMCGRTQTFNSQWPASWTLWVQRGKNTWTRGLEFEAAGSSVYQLIPPVSPHLLTYLQIWNLPEAAAPVLLPCPRSRGGAFLRIQHDATASPYPGILSLSAFIPSTVVDWLYLAFFFSSILFSRDVKMGGVPHYVVQASL